MGNTFVLNRKAQEARKLKVRRGNSCLRRAYDKIFTFAGRETMFDEN